MLQDWLWRRNTTIETARKRIRQYEWDAHKPLALKASLEPEFSAGIADGRRPSVMDDTEAAAVDFLFELQQNKSVSDATYARVVKTAGEKDAADLIGVTRYYSLLTR